MRQKFFHQRAVLDQKLSKHLVIQIRVSSAGNHKTLLSTLLRLDDVAL